MTKVASGRIQVDDFCAVQIVVCKYPKAHIDIHPESGKERLSLQELSLPKLVTIHALLDPEGQLVWPATQYLYSLKRNLYIKDTGPHAQALLLYFRFLKASGLRYDYFPEDEDDRPTYRFRDYLKECMADRGINIAISTGRSRLRNIIAFYRYLFQERMIAIDSPNTPFKSKLVKISINAQKKTANRDMLAHTKARGARLENDSGTTAERFEKTVQSTDLMASMPKNQSVESPRKLKPMKPDHKDLFYSQLHMLTEEKRLMLRMGTECGLRRIEFTTFPVSAVRRPSDSEPVKVLIGPYTNGCQTKNDKEGEIEVPASLMWDLYDYMLGEERIKREKNGKSEERLFLNTRGKPFQPNTVDTFFANYRKKLKKLDQTWKYAVHDLRATFATYKLDELLEEHGKLTTAGAILQELMRHEDFRSTVKYLQFFEENMTLKSHGRDLNFIAAKALKGAG